MASSYASIERTFKEGGSNWSKAYDHNYRLDGVEYPFMEKQWMNHELIENVGDKDFRERAFEKVDRITETYSPDDKEMKRLKNYAKTARRYKDGGRRLKASATMAFEAVLSYNRGRIGEGPNAKYEEIPLDYDMEERKRWEDVSLEWAKEYFKNPVTGENNIISATVHYDEISPHIHLIITPINGDKLDRDYWAGGGAKTAEFTHAYGDLMSKEFGLERPKKHSVAKNVAIKKTRAVVNEVVSDAERKITFIEPEKSETIEEYKNRWKEHVNEIKDVFSDMAASTWKMEADYKTKLANLETKIKDPELYNKREIESLKNTVSYLQSRLDKERSELGERIRTLETFVYNVIKCQSMEEVQDQITELTKSINMNEELLNELLRIEREADEREKEKEEQEKKKKKKKIIR